MKKELHNRQEGTAKWILAGLLGGWPVEIPHAPNSVIPRVRDTGPASDAATHIPASFKNSINICCWPAIHQVLCSARVRLERQLD